MTKKIEETIEVAKPVITPIEFADVATLKEKLNEIIAHLNG